MKQSAKCPCWGVSLRRFLMTHKWTREDALREGVLSTRREALRLGGAGIAALAMPAVLRPSAAYAADTLVVASFGGGWAAAMNEAFHKPFTAETGINVIVADGADL